MPRWVIFIIIIGALWQVVSAIIQQASKKQELEKQQEASRRASLTRTQTQGRTAPTPTTPSAAGHTHAETLAERRRAQIEELRARRQGRGTAGATQTRTPSTTSRSPTPIKPAPAPLKPVPLPRTRGDVKPVAVTTTSSRVASSATKPIRALKPNLKAIQAELPTSVDRNRRTLEKRQLLERQRAEDVRRQAREKAERARKAKVRRVKTRPEEDEGVHRLVRDTPRSIDPYVEHAHADRVREIRTTLTRPRSLQNAILLTEILGKPVGLR